VPVPFISVGIPHEIVEYEGYALGGKFRLQVCWEGEGGVRRRMLMERLTSSLNHEIRNNTVKNGIFVI
jgi:hypothetical protein